MIIRKIIDGILLFLFPNRCILCGQVILPGKKVCDECMSNLPYNKKFVLAPDKNRKNLYCCRASFYYTGPIRSGVLGLKFHNVTASADFFAQYMAQLTYSGVSEEYDFIISVPISDKRLKKRGYNQSDLIAREYALLVGKRYDPDVLKKIRDNDAQSSLLSFQERRENVRNCYCITDKAKVLGKRILLIDDVYTSGSTLKECAAVLRQEGAQCVIGLVVAVALKTK